MRKVISGFMYSSFITPSLLSHYLTSIQRFPHGDTSQNVPVSLLTGRLFC
jgi:hypothetical protein